VRSSATAKRKAAMTVGPCVEFMILDLREGATDA